MSAIRNNARRAEARKKHALPYGRAIVRNVLRVLGFVNEDDQPELPTTTQSNDQIMTNEQIPSNTARVQDNVFQATTQQPTFGNRQPLAQVDFSNISTRGAMDPPSSVSAVPDARSVANYFSQKTGTNVDTKTVESMVTELQTTPDKTEKFRFTFTTPTRESSTFFANPNGTPTTSSAPSSSKKLTRNPNGVYRWEGAGSAKHARSRNRFASPAFGASPAKNDRLVMKDTNGSGETDHKRRRTGESSTLESSGSSLPFPITASPSTSKTNGMPARSSAPSPSVPATSAATPSTRLRTPAKPTAPVVPSPLRQAWSDASSTSSRDESRRSPTQVKPTKTANFMAELIKETIPPKKPDLSNPYQSASPVGKVGPPRRGTKRTRATGRPALPSREDKGAEEQQKQEKNKEAEKDKMDQYSPQAIIEATVPKGSKRSRPPTHFEKTNSSNGNNCVNGDSPSTVAEKDVVYTVEEPEDDGSSRATKKLKPSLNGNGRPSSFFDRPAPSAMDNISIEEVDDVSMSDEGKGKDTPTNGSAPAAAPATAIATATTATASASASALTSRASFSGLKSIPKEPSKLRFSFQAEGSPASSSTLPASAPPASTSSPKPSQPVFAAPEQPKFTPPSSGFSFSFQAGESVTTDEPKPTQLEGNKHESKPLSVEEIQKQVQAMDSKSLPVFSFTFTGTHPGAADYVRARGDVKVLPPSSLPTFDFSKPVVVSPSDFKFDLTPTKSNPTPPTFTMGSFNSKPSASHDTPTPPRVVAPSVTPFNFAAAGMKMEVKKNIWTCFCGVSNDNNAAKCIACESPAPASSSNGPTKSAEALKPAAPAVKGFDFAAAGFKMPTPKSDTWTCAECTLTNPNSATKCEPCGADRPSAAGTPAPAAKPPAAPPAPPVQAFNFAAAGFKMPTANKDAWTCSECTLSNPNSATKCAPCGADRK